jgi:hypothetical protein
MMARRRVTPLMARPAVRFFAEGELMKQDQDGIAKNVVAKEDKPLFTELESYG